MTNINVFQIYKNESNKLNNMRKNHSIHSLKMYNGYIQKSFFEIIKHIENKVNVIALLIELNKYEDVLKRMKKNENLVKKDTFYNILKDEKLVKYLYTYKIKLLKKTINIILEKAIL